ncbi:hypothetical protein IGI37_002743 [Enterococcus sp. AZ194]|uniref:YeeE/YedE family protein n=1 Tax=Enterococcus sp. AZ194 TaxID=2774629 RepID=UPI003F1F8B8A
MQEIGHQNEVDSVGTQRLIFNSQPIIGAIVVVVLVGLGFYLNNVKASLAMHLFAGVLMGYVLSRARFGFAGGIKRIFVRGEGSLSKALIIMFAITMFITLGIQWYSAQAGAVPDYLAEKGQAIIPGTQNVAFTNIATIVGGLCFGIGMIFSGGCASGTLTDLGEGEGRAFVTLIFFIIGSAPGEIARKIVDGTTIGKIGMQVYLPETFGFFAAILLSLLGLVLLYSLAVKYEIKRKALGSYHDPLGDWEDFEKPADNNHSLTLFEKAYHKLFIERWTFMRGGILIAFIWVFILVTQHKAWGVTSSFSKMSVFVGEAFGLHFTNTKLVELSQEISGGIWFDGGTIRNFGLIIGALLAFLLAGRFKLNFNFKVKDAGYFIAGGLLMGFGARFAKGCNVGALYSAMSTFSISGWVFLIAMISGGVFALKVFAGKACTLPKL